MFIYPLTFFCNFTKVLFPKDKGLLHHIPVILYMIRAFFGCFGNQIIVNAVCIKLSFFFFFFFLVSDMLKSKFYKHNKCAIRTKFEIKPQFSWTFLTPTSETSTNGWQSSEKSCKNLHKNKFSNFTNFNESCLKLFLMITLLKKVYMHLLFQNVLKYYFFPLEAGLSNRLQYCNLSELGAINLANLTSDNMKNRFD